MSLLHKSAMMITLLAGTALGTAAHAQDQNEELLKPKSQNSQSMQQQDQTDQSSSKQLKQQDQAQSPDSSTTDQSQSTMTRQNQDQNAASDDQSDEQLKKHKNRVERQDQNGQNMNQNASDEGQSKGELKKKHQTASEGKQRNKENTAKLQGQTDENGNTASDDHSKKRMNKIENTAESRKLKKNESENEASSNKVSKETTGSINITTSEKTVIRDTIVKAHVRPAHLDVKVTVGIRVPKKIKLYTLPPRVVELVPAYRGYEYFVLADGRIVIVDPDTYEVVYIIVA